jgi:hypothetical protein
MTENAEELRIRILLGQWIQIQKCERAPQQTKKGKVLPGKLEASPRALESFLL